MEAVKEYTTKLAKQIRVEKDGHVAICRWDNETKTLCFQNRSHDTAMSLDDFMNRLNTTVKQAKAKGWMLSITDVPLNSKWI